MMFRLKNRFVIIVVILIFMLTISGNLVYADGPPEDKILQQVAGDQGVSLDNLQLATLEQVKFRLTGLTLYQAKVIDSKSGQIYGLVVDGEGEVQELEAVLQAEGAAYDAQYGRLAPELYDMLQTMGADETVTVAIWLKYEDLTVSRPQVEHTPSGGEAGDAPLPPAAPDSQKPTGPLVEEKEEALSGASSERVAEIRDRQADRRVAIDAAGQANRDQLADQMAVLQQPLLADLAAQDFSPTEVSRLAPLIYVELPKSALLDLAQRADIDAIYGPHENADAMNIAKPTQKANIVDSLGFDGTGIEVAILEDSRIQFNNPYLNAGTTRVPLDPNVDDHATGTAGMVASQHGTYQGVSQGVDLLSANATIYLDPNLSAAMDWAVSQNADTINNSWGDDVGFDLNEHDRHLDYIVRVFARVVTVAAGNEGTTSGRVGSPARAFNVLSVGNHFDNETTAWDDDSMAPSSSYIDPSTGVEKPEVSAVGGSDGLLFSGDPDIISTTASNPWIDDITWGTSYAAPMVAGLSAILLERDSELLWAPESVKAIVMATALNNIEGSSRLSEYDGAGGIDMLAGFRAADEGWWDLKFVSSSSFPYSYNVYAYAGETVRAVITWDSNPNSSYTTDPLQADIDLIVYDPSDSLVASSTYIFNNFEIVHFTAGQTGWYELEIDDWRFDGSNEYVGAAWWLGHRVLNAYGQHFLGTPPVVGDYFRFDASLYWNAVGIRSPSGSDYDVYLYRNSAFGDPDDHTWLEDSTLSSTVDFVVLDRNHAPAGSYYPEVKQYSGTGGSYPTEWASHTTDIDAPGTYGPYTMGSNDVVRIWDIYFDAGEEHRVVVRQTSGSADLGVALVDSDPGTSSSFYQGRSQAVVDVDINGSGSNEMLNYTNSGDADRMGLVVFNNSAASATFYLDVDTDGNVYLPIIIKN